jgi:hypothetical protein
MAVSDLIQGLGFTAREEPEDDLPDIPDDARDLVDPDDTGEEELVKDPKPARKKTRRISIPEGTVKATPAERRQIKDALGLLIKVPAGIWSMKDPHCGGALAEQADDIIKAVLPMACRHPAAIRFFTSTNAPWLDLLGLIMALAPVGSAVYGHHIAHTVGQPEGGNDGPDLSAYAAPQF